MSGNNASPTGVYKKGTAASNSAEADNTTYNDLLAIWYNYNGTSTLEYPASALQAGVPDGWGSGFYWSATPQCGQSG
jgi:hypothetical protein